jgi:hypothetical protein
MVASFVCIAKGHCAVGCKVKALFCSCILAQFIFLLMGCVLLQYVCILQVVERAKESNFWATIKTASFFNSPYLGANEWFLLKRVYSCYACVL